MSAIYHGRMKAAKPAFGTYFTATTYGACYTDLLWQLGQTGYHIKTYRGWMVLAFVLFTIQKIGECKARPVIDKAAAAHTAGAAGSCAVLLVRC